MHSGPTASELLHARPEMKYLPAADFARLDYGRLLWKNPKARARLLAHWTDPRHPYHERFAEHRTVVESILSAPVERLDDISRHHGISLRAILRAANRRFQAFKSRLYLANSGEIRYPPPRRGVARPRPLRGSAIAWRADNPSLPLKDYIKIVRDLSGEGTD
jgi:hypothetical protein